MRRGGAELALEAESSALQRVGGEKALFAQLGACADEVDQQAALKHLIEAQVENLSKVLNGENQFSVTYFRGKKRVSGPSRISQLHPHRSGRLEGWPRPGVAAILVTVPNEHTFDVLQNLEPGLGFCGIENNNGFLIVPDTGNFSVTEVPKYEATSCFVCHLQLPDTGEWNG